MSTLNDVIVAELRCSLCQRTIHPPISECSVGHSLCIVCYYSNRDDRCAMCWAPVEKEVSCLALDRIHNKLRYPCRYADKGCKEKVLYNAKEEHEDHCPVTLMPCLLKRFVGCSWTGSEISRRDFLTHCFLYHASHTLAFEVQGHLRNLFKNPGIRDEIVPYLIVRKSKPFILTWRFLPFAKLLLHSLFYVDPQDAVHHCFYHVKICKAKRDSEERYPCRLMEEDYTMKQTLENVGHYNYESIKKYFKKNWMTFSVDVHFTVPLDDESSYTPSD